MDEDRYKAENRDDRVKFIRDRDPTKKDLTDT